MRGGSVARTGEADLLDATCKRIAEGQARMPDYRKINDRFGQLLALVRPLLPPEDISQPQEFYDVGEYELALEDLCFYLRDNAAPISRDVYDRIRAIAAELGMDRSTWEAVSCLVMER